MSAQSDVLKNSKNVDMRRQRYSRMMQLLSLSMIVSSIMMTTLMILINANIELIAFVFSTLLVYLILFFIFRTGFFRVGFYGMIYMISLNGLIGNTLIGWRSGTYVILFLLVPILFYNPVISKRERFVLSVYFGLLLLFTSIMGFLIVPTTYLSALHLQIMNGFYVFMTCLIMAGISYLDFRYSNEIASRLIDLNHQLSYQASRDSLTNLLNRRTMNQLIQMEYARSNRSGKPFGLIMADVDDFKQVNDDYGHAAGDLVLTELSAMISATLRKQDSTARWGGEEFLILLPETDYEGVQVASEKVRDLVSRSSFLYQGKSIRVTLSIGGVVCQQQEDWDDCIKHADRALYYGKRHGKNLAIFSKGEAYCILGELGETV